MLKLGGVDMKLIKIHAGDIRVCRDCKKEIVWLKSYKKNKSYPVNAVRAFDNTGFSEFVPTFHNCRGLKSPSTKMNLFKFASLLIMFGISLCQPAQAYRTSGVRLVRPYITRTGRFVRPHIRLFSRQYRSTRLY